MGRRPITANEMGRKGGTTRAKRYSKAQIRAWGKLGGRPPKLGPSEIDQLHKWVRHGEPKAVVARKLGISTRTLDRYSTK